MFIEAGEIDSNFNFPVSNGVRFSLVKGDCSGGLKTVVGIVQTGS